MSGYLIAFGWGLVLLSSFVGWGAVLTRPLFGRPATVDWGLKGGWGVALSVCVGGLLNLAGAVSRSVVMGWVVAGSVFWVVDVASRSGRRLRHTGDGSATHRDRFTRVGIVVALLTVLQYAGWVYTPVKTGDSYFVFPQESASIVFNVHDDFHAYFVFPKKMLATGALGEEPFSERRLNALGGQSFLQTFVLAALPEENLHLLEPGVAMLLVLGLLGGYLRDRGVPARTGVWVLLAFLLVPPPYMNISALVVGMVLFIALFRTLSSRELAAAGPITHAIAAALCTAGICALKSSLLPAGVLLIVMGYAAVLIDSGIDRNVMRGAAAALVLTTAFVLPWMLAMYDAFGTPLFPVLGLGPRADGEAPAGTLLAANAPFVDVLQILAGEITSASVVALALCAFAVHRWRSDAESRDRHVLLAFAVSTFLGMLIVAFLLIGLDTFRFHYPFVVAAILVSVISLIAGSGARTSTVRAIAASIGAALLIGWSWNSVKFFYAGLVNSTTAGVLGTDSLSVAEREQYPRMQAAIPEGKAALAMLEKPFLLDFRRNPIFIVDSPGSMPPSVPKFDDAEELASYLVDRSIQYVAYSYRTGAGIPRTVFGDGADTEPYYLRIFEFQDLLEDLGRTRARIYDDGEMFVADLASTHRPVEQE